MEKSYKVLGLMSGSSLDGLDLAFCKYDLSQGLEDIKWEIIAADTLPYSETWINRLRFLPQQDALTFAKTNAYFGHYLAELSQQFLYKHQLQPDFIASHGHTIFHYPDKRISIQIGDGAAMAALTGLPVITDFRTHDIAINGEGTPIAPAADRYLFKGFDFYLNLGGIANISAEVNQQYLAFDIGPANQVLNVLANGLDMDYDAEGAQARQGTLQKDLLGEIDQIDFFAQDYPKSLDNNWIRQNVIPTYLNHPSSLQDRLSTATEQLAAQIGKAITHIQEKENWKKANSKMYITGGGAFNTYLLERIDHYCQPLDVQIVVPTEKVVQFKEAILMGLMGVLRMEQVPNCFASVTGAKRNTVGGAVYYG